MNQLVTSQPLKTPAQKPTFLAASRMAAELPPPAMHGRIPTYTNRPFSEGYQSDGIELAAHLRGGSIFWLEVRIVTTKEAAGRQCILEQARRLFLTHGYHAVSIRDIVQACNLSNAALYYHFGSKQALFLQVFKEHVARGARRLQEAGADPGPCRDRLTRMAEAHARFILEWRSEMEMLHRDLEQSGKEEIKRILPGAMRQIPSLFAAVLEEGMEAGEIRSIDAHSMGTMLMGMTNALAAHRALGRTARPLVEEIELAISTLFEGIGKHR